MKKKINFDVNATERPTRYVLAVLRKIYRYGYSNPSAAYFDAQRTLNSVERAREQTALALGCDKDEIFFTSGASEANSLIQANIILDVDERSHHSLQRMDDLKEYAKVKALPLIVSETGELLIDEILNNPKQQYFVDLTQAIGKVKINLHSMPNIIYASGGGHKFGGILGCGIIYIKKEHQSKINPLIYGSQEKGLRGGTYNVPAIICFGEAIEQANKNINKYNKKINKIILEILNKITLFDNIKFRTNNNVINITFNNLLATTVVQLFDKYGINISAGSACSSGNEEASKAYIGSGYTEEEALRTIRISIGYLNTKREAHKFVKVLKKIIDIYEK